MKVKVDRVIDGDSTIYTTPDGERLRSRSKNTASLESTTTTGKQSLKGIDQTARVKTYVKPEDTLEIEDNPDRGVFDRVLVSPQKMYNGELVDVNGLKSMLGDNAYYTKYGLSDDNHGNLKTTYSKWLPYQFKDNVAPLTPEEFEEIDAKLPVLQRTIDSMKTGDNDEKQLFLDTMIGDLFGGDKADKVAAYLDIKKRRELTIDMEGAPLSAEKIMRDAFKDPRMQEEWDRSVMSRTSSDDVRLAYKGTHHTWQEKAGAAMQLFNDMSNYIDRGNLFAAENSNLKITDERLGSAMTDIPAEFRGIVTDEARKYGNERAYVKARQLKKDIQSHAIFDDANIAEQFLYGAGAYVTSLGSVAVGAKGFSLANKATQVVRAWEANSAIKALATSGAWTGAAFTDSVAMEAPRLLGDATYSPEEMVVDVVLDTALGAALPLMLMGGSKVIKPHVRQHLVDGHVNKAYGTKTIEKELYESTKRAPSNNEQLGAGIKAWEEARGPQPGGEAAHATNRETVGTTTESNPPDASVNNNNGTESHVSPIGDRPPVVGEDGVPRSTGEVDAERSVSNERNLTGAELSSIRSQTAAEALIDGGWVASGLDATHTAAKKSIGLLGKLGQGMADTTGKAMSHSMQLSDNAAMRFIGHNILEDPSGYAGNMKRHSTAAMSATKEKNSALSLVLPDYARHIEEWSIKKGSMFHETFKAKWGTPDGNKLAKQFEKEFIEAINARKMGRNIEHVSPSIVKMLNSWKNFTDHMGNRAIEESLPGWTKLRQNYFPQIRDNQKMANFIQKNDTGSTSLERLFEKGMLSTREAGLHDLDKVTIKDLARKMVEQAKTGQKELPKSTSEKLGRAQHRVEMDWSVTEGDLTLHDFLQTDIALTADKYSSDLGGRLGLNEVTGGKIVTDADIQGFKDVAHATNAEAIQALTNAGDSMGAAKLEKQFAKEVQMMDESFNMVLGRPPGKVLAPELRHLKTFTTLTRMGVLGTSQSIETGNIIARNTMDLFTDPEVLKHMMAMKPDTPEGKKLLEDVMNITGRTVDMEYLHRPQQVLDEETMKSYSGLRQLSVMLADKATGGSMKQPASRLLGKTSMFNWVQKHQSEYVQKSFLIHTDRYFTKGKSSINPKRMIDLGLIDLDGKNTELAHVFNNVIKKNEHGHIIDLQWDKWSAKAKKEYMSAAQRDEAQRLQQTFAGEAPAYYNKPLMNLLFQFREVPLVAQNKQLARNLMFGDVEAASSVMLNLAVAGMVRFGWLAGMGYAKATVEGERDSFRLPKLDRLDIMRYMASGGMLPDAIEIANSGFQSYNQKDAYQVFRQIPALGVLKDAKDFALGNNEVNTRAEAVQGLTLLGNTAWMDVIHTMFVKNINEMATFKEQEGE